jgi:hypothetical protein
VPETLLRSKIECWETNTVNMNKIKYELIIIGIGVLSLVSGFGYRGKAPISSIRLITLGIGALLIGILGLIFG